MAPVINVRNLYNNVFRHKLIKGLLPVNPTAKQAANLALWSTLTKDALGCYMYTTQSYKNKEIPDERRTFVTAVDFSNGVCNVFIPMITGPILSKHSDKLFNKWFGHNFDDAACARMYDTLKKSGKQVSKDMVNHVVKKQSRNWGVAGFGVITMLVYSQILVKRMITPTISTSLADVVKVQIEKMEERKQAKEEQLKKLIEDKEKSENTCEKCENENEKTSTISSNPFYVTSSSFQKFDNIILGKK